MVRDVEALRDWFAGQALSAIIQDYMKDGLDCRTPSVASTHAYRIADAMLKERKENPCPQK